ncbi:MAG: hypothetical protein K2O28_04820 [Clostridia bacterium]|nr:hypothetical protein [Clostridia bacterium]
MCTIDLDKCFDPRHTDASVNIVSYGFRIKYCKDYLAKYQGTKNYISSGNTIKNLFMRSMYKIRKNQDSIDGLIKDLDSSRDIKISILLRIIAKLIQILPSVAVGPEILDPIIIEINEGTLSTVHKVVANYASSPIRPVIILLLDDKSDSDKIFDILKKLPINLKVAIHDDWGNTEVKTILVNCGAENLNEFLEAYASQCFYTCGNTDREIIINNVEEGDELNLLNCLFMKSHSSLLIDDKISAKEDIEKINQQLERSQLSQKLLSLFKCINSLNGVFATDFGGNNILNALNYSKEINDPLITAFVNRFAHFFPNTTYSQKAQILNSAADEFNKRKMIDHKLYCKNNALTYSYYTNSLDIGKFKSMLSEAVVNVPGLTGMSILYNNVGTAELYNRNPFEALANYQIGLDNATALNRPSQRIGLIGNIAIAETLLGKKHSTDYFVNAKNSIIHMPNTKSMPFIQINGLMNILAVALYENNIEAVRDISTDNNFKEILKKSLLPTNMGTGSLVTQLNVLSQKGNGVLDFNNLITPQKLTRISGLRHDYILENGFNPAIGNAWL